MSKNYIVFDSMMVPPQKNFFLLLYCIIFDNKFLLILRNSKLLSINFLCVTLSHMSIGARIVGTITFQQVYDTPHAQASAESHNKGLQSINSGRKELHIASISPGFSPAMKKAAHTGGRLRPLDTLSRSGIYTKASGSSTSS